MLAKSCYNRHPSRMSKSFILVKKQKELSDLINDINKPAELVDLVDFVREKAGGRSSKLWIISPFCGSRQVLSLFGIDAKNPKKYGTDFKLLTDIRNVSRFNYSLLDFFCENGELRTLKNLHAKLYMMGNYCIITSANLSRRAFFYNHEFALVQNTPDLYEKYFNDLWNESKIVTKEMLIKAVKDSKITYDNDDITDTSELVRSLPKEWEMESDYATFLNAFKKLEEIYGRSGRIWSSSPLKFEIDSFLNFLFHHEEDVPSVKYYCNNDYEKITREEQASRINKHAQNFKNWLNSDKIFEGEGESRRLGFELDVKKYLNQPTVEKFVDILTKCINAYGKGNVRFGWGDKFLKNNSLEDVVSYVKKLSVCKPEEVDKLVKNPPLNPFGKSSAQELLGLLRDEYPIRNENTNAGLRYLGFNV